MSASATSSASANSYQSQLPPNHPVEKQKLAPMEWLQDHKSDWASSIGMVGLGFAGTSLISAVAGGILISAKSESTNGVRLLTAGGVFAAGALASGYLVKKLSSRE